MSIKCMWHSDKCTQSTVAVYGWHVMAASLGMYMHLCGKEGGTQIVNNIMVKYHTHTDTHRQPVDRAQQYLTFALTLTFLPPLLPPPLLALSLLSGGRTSVRFMVLKATWLLVTPAFPIPPLLLAHVSQTGAPPSSAVLGGREIRRPGFQMSTGEKVTSSAAVVLLSCSSTMCAKVSRLLVDGGRSLPGVLHLGVLVGGGYYQCSTLNGIHKLMSKHLESGDQTD